MGWNGSTGDSISIKVKPTKNTWLSLGIKLFLGALIASGGCAVWYAIYSHGQSHKTNSAKNTSSLIPSVNPSIAKNSLSSPPPLPHEKKKYKDLTNEERLKYWRDKYGDNLPDNIKPIVYYLENEPKVNYRGRSSISSVFKYHAERDIAEFLMVEPGTWIMKPVTFGERFDKDLALSMGEGIEILSDDSEDVRNLKKAVIDAKNYMLEEAKKGKSPSTILSEASQELYTLGQYKRDLESEIRALKNDPTVSDDDLKFSVEAANKMLEKKGLKPLRQPNMLIRHAILKRKGRLKK